MAIICHKHGIELLINYPQEEDMVEEFMKKLIAVLLTLGMLLGMATVAGAEGESYVFWYTFSDVYLSSVRAALDSALDGADSRPKIVPCLIVRRRPWIVIVRCNCWRRASRS